MHAFNVLSLLLPVTMVTAAALPNPAPASTTVSSASTTTTAPTSCTSAPSATAVSPPPATATCGVYGGETTEGVFPLNYEHEPMVPDTAACAQLCLTYGNQLCKSFALSTTDTGSSCILFAYTVQELDVQPQQPQYAPGPAFYDESCYALACSS